MNIKRILSLCDFSAGSEHAIERAAQLAARHGLSLELVYWGGFENQRLADFLGRLAMRSRQLERRYAIEVANPFPSPAELGRQMQRQPRAAEILVVAHSALLRRFPARWAWLPARNMLELARCPLLIVKRTVSGPYARMLAVCKACDSGALPEPLPPFVRGSHIELLHLNPAPAAAARCAAAAADGSASEWPPPGAGRDGGGIHNSDQLASRRNRLAHRRGEQDAVRLIANQADYSGSDLVLAHYRPSPWAQRGIVASFQQRLDEALDCDLLLLPGEQLSACRAARRLRPAVASGLAVDPAPWSRQP